MVSRFFDSMSRRRTFWLLVPRPVRRLPADLAAAVAVTLLVNAAVFLPVVAETPLRLVVGLPFVLFVPGYVFVAALFPEDGSPVVREDVDLTGDGEADATAWEDRSGGIDGIERVALSFGLSIAVVPLIGLALNFTPWGIRLVPIMVALSGFALAGAGLAAARRWQLPPGERFRVPYGRWYADARAELFEPATRTDAALNALLVVSVLVATASVGYAVAVPQQGEQFSEFYLLTESESGDLVADGYPTNFTAGEPRELIVGVGNHEHERTDYTVVTEIQRVDVVDNETVVREATELRRFDATVDHNETWHRRHEVAPSMTGDRLRLQYLLYRGDPPSPLNRSAAYRDLHLWVNVSR